jgi:hypothetical protein
MFFKVLGTMMTACVFMLWVAVSIPTLRGFITGSLFQAPCLVKLPELLQDKENRQREKKMEEGQGQGQARVQEATSNNRSN